MKNKTKEKIHKLSADSTTALGLMNSIQFIANEVSWSVKDPKGDMLLSLFNSLEPLLKDNLSLIDQIEFESRD